LTPLLKLLKNEGSSVQVKKLVVDILWNLTSAPGGKDVLRGRGCIETMLALVFSESNNGIRSSVIGALCVMAHRNIANQKTIRKAVNIENLLNLLMDEDIDVRFLTAALLSKQALNTEMKECQLKLANNDIVTCAKPSDALAMLASSITLTDIIGKDISWLTPLVMLLSDRDINIELRRKVTSVLMKLADEKDYGDIIRELGGVTVLVKMLSHADTEIHSNVSTALASLMQNEVNRQLVEESRGFRI
jgi:hypothetical protein